MSLPLVDDYVKRSNLLVDVVVEFQLNLGTSLATAIDVTKYVSNLGDLSIKLSKSNIDVGGVTTPKVSITFDNSKRFWDIDGKFFKDGFVNNSVIKITTNFKKYSSGGGFSSAFSLAFRTSEIYKDVSPSLAFTGLIKTTSCTWDESNFKFKCPVLGLSNLFSSYSIEPGWFVGGSFSDSLYSILNRSAFTKYLTIDTDNWEFGYDVADVITDTSGLVNSPIKTTLDKIMELSGSIYYINYENALIVEPVQKSKTVTWDVTGDDIISVMSTSYNWSGQFNAIKWSREDEQDLVVQMSFSDRQANQYDYRQKILDHKFISTSTTIRLALMENLLSVFKHLKKEVSLVTKWNPNVVINSYITLDIPQEAIIGDNYLIFNKSGHDWNDGHLWGNPQVGLTFDSSVTWRVIELKVNLEGESMTLKLKEV